MNVNAWSILAIVLAIAAIALVGFLIPVLIQIRDTLKTAEQALNKIEKEVEPVLHHVEGITENFEGLTGAANDFVYRKTHDNSPGMIDNLKVTVRENTQIVKTQYLPVLQKYLRAFGDGVRVGVHSFKETGRTDLIRMPDQQYSPPLKTSVTTEPVIVDHMVNKV